MDATGVGVGFLIPVIVVASCALHLAYPHRRIYIHTSQVYNLFSDFLWRRLWIAMAGKRCICGGMVFNASGTGDPVRQGSAVSSLHKTETLDYG